YRPVDEGERAQEVCPLRALRRAGTLQADAAADEPGGNDEARVAPLGRSDRVPRRFTSVLSADALSAHPPPGLGVSQGRDRERGVGAAGGRTGAAGGDRPRTGRLSAPRRVSGGGTLLLHPWIRRRPLPDPQAGRLLPRGVAARRHPNFAGSLTLRVGVR